jgi:enoyl-CoA hydratase
MEANTMKVLVERNGPITTIIINRIDVKNAVDPETAQLLRDAFQAFDEDDDQKVAVFAGAGGTFCAGYDLKAFGASGEVDLDPEDEGPMGPSRMLLRKPVIAAVDGFAVAGGLELSLWCDMRVADEDAVFGVFCRRWGVPLIDGGTVRLPRIVGMGRALDMILTGRAVEADEALSWGLANRVVPKGTARQVAQDLALEISRFPELCMKADRMSAYRQSDLDLEQALRNEAREGDAPLRQGAQSGAQRFASGKGRSGSFEDI